MTPSSIRIRGAREHNLKEVDLDIPRDQLVVITGLSGSGKSTLAFDTVFAEGQRRYVESLSAYARQFLDQMEKPDVDSIEGLSPAISIEQKTTSRNPRSTVATVTEIFDYLRLLYARIGHPHCPQCGKPIVSQTPTQIIDEILQLPEGTAIFILAPVIRDRKGEYRKLFEGLKAKGYSRAQVDGEWIRLDQPPTLDRQLKHSIDVVIDRIKVRSADRERVADAVENALLLSEGLVQIQFRDTAREPLLMSQHLVCLDCGVSFPELQPRNFSFNSPHGACPACDGLGESREFDPTLIIAPHKSIADGAILSMTSRENGWHLTQIKKVAQHFEFSIHTPFRALSKQARDLVLYGTDEELMFVFQKNENRYQFRSRFEGIIPNLKRRYKETQSSAVREQLESFMSMNPCETCSGARLQPFPLSVLIQDLNIAQTTALSVEDASRHFSGMTLTGNEAIIADKILKEVQERLHFLMNVGLGYLTLDRRSGTLSGGESQRIRLATQLGSRLQGVLYVLDEPTIGLHQRDNQRLIKTLKGMRDLGNTVLVVEHDRDTMLEADFLVDLGPGAGEHGGHVVFAGTPTEILNHASSITGRYLSGRETIPIPPKRRSTKRRKKLRIHGARANNLKSIDVEIPCGVLTCVTGVSGSGKSTLVHEIIYKAAHRHIYGSGERPGEHDAIHGLDHFDKIIEIDQSPIGRTPRSNPATYVGLFTPLRELFAMLPESRARGYTPGRFSFNVKGGRCETCQGGGLIRIEMHFLPDVYVTCEQCKGRRYNRETLEITYGGKTIADVLDMTVEQASAFFENVPAVMNRLNTLMDVGLTYIRLGQPATTLSGGEAQRVKLSKELSKRDTGKTLYILDEPTTGLHFDDVRKLLHVIHRLTDQRNTVIIIEHNLDVIANADYLVDLGPEGGQAGGQLLACGAPEEVAALPESFTGQFLAPILGQMPPKSARGPSMLPHSAT